MIAKVIRNNEHSVPPGTIVKIVNSKGLPKGTVAVEVTMQWYDPFNSNNKPTTRTVAFNLKELEVQ